jgi:hypothetical protein
MQYTIVTTPSRTGAAYTSSLLQGREIYLTALEPKGRNRIQERSSDVRGMGSLPPFNKKPVLFPALTICRPTSKASLGVVT